VELSSVYETELPLLGPIKSMSHRDYPQVPCCSKVLASNYLFDFDLVTGTLSNLEVLPGVGTEAGEFSTNSAYLYRTITDPTSGSQQLVRYNILGRKHRFTLHSRGHCRRCIYFLHADGS
jgi:hypothetical protein